MTSVPAATSRLVSLTNYEEDDEDPVLIVNGPAFFKELDRTVEYFILDCFQLDGNKGRDPRARHEFYQLIYNNLKTAVTRGFLKKTDTDFMPHWQKYDDWTASAVHEFLAGKDVNGQPRKFASEVPVIPFRDKKFHEVVKHKIQNYIKQVFLKSRNERNQFDLSSLKVRITFFKHVNKCSPGIMNHYWHRLLYSTLDQLLLYQSVVTQNVEKQKCSRKQKHSEKGDDAVMMAVSLPSFEELSKAIKGIPEVLQEEIMVELEVF